MKSITEVLTKTMESPVVNFLLFWAANVAVYISVFGGLMDVLPPRLDWLTNVAFPACVVGGFISSAIAIRRTKDILPSIEAVVKSAIITLLGMLVLVTLYTASFAFSPTRYVTLEQFESAGLTAQQATQIQKILDAKGYISLSELETLNLSPVQQSAVKRLLDDLGYATVDDVEKISANIAKTQIALVATQTAVAKFTQCYITPENGYANVAIRLSPSEKSDYVGAFAQGQNLYVIGHNGGRVNQDRWWLVEIGNEPTKKYGWVASWVVTEINESECLKVEKAPGVE